MVAPVSRIMIAGSLSSCIAGFRQSCRSSPSSGPRRSCVGTGPAFAATGVGSRDRGFAQCRLPCPAWKRSGATEKQTFTLYFSRFGYSGWHPASKISATVEIGARQSRGAYAALKWDFIRQARELGQAA